MTGKGKLWIFHSVFPIHDMLYKLATGISTNHVFDLRSYIIVDFDVIFRKMSGKSEAVSTTDGLSCSGQTRVVRVARTGGWAPVLCLVSYSPTVPGWRGRGTRTPGGAWSS